MSIDVSTVSLGSASDQFPSALLDDGVAAASSTRVAVTAVADVTPHTVGAWVEVDASLSAAASGVRVALTASTNLTANNSSTLLDIGIGAGGAETVWATIGVGYIASSTAASIYPLVVPGRIAAGTRVAVRARSAITLQNVVAEYSFFGAKTTALGAPVTYQADIATSHGLALAAPGSLNTKGAWTELVASTATALAALLVTAQGNEGAAMGTLGLLLDIGVGAAGSEVVVIPDISYRATTAEVLQARSPTTYGLVIPAGSRIAARYARAATTESLDVLLVGAPPA